MSTYADALIEESTRDLSGQKLNAALINLADNFKKTRSTKPALEPKTITLKRLMRKSDGSYVLREHEFVGLPTLASVAPNKIVNVPKTLDTIIEAFKDEEPGAKARDCDLWTALEEAAAEHEPNPLACLAWSRAMCLFVLARHGIILTSFSQLPF